LAGVARWYLCTPKISLLIYFFRALELQMFVYAIPIWPFWYNWWPLVYFKVISLVNMFPVCVCCTKNHPATLRVALIRILDGKESPTRGRCYDHNFQRLLPIFGEKNWRFSQKPMLWSKFCIIYLWFESKTPIFSLNFFAENNLKIITSVPEEC
jgi:hypothetical protein